ncbi:MAG: MFS transporter [Candidatus Eremiobacteraeota bacterium]|nr:MFS transporter [Candidatus Eremiobacteraeota bacterium]
MSTPSPRAQAALRFVMAIGIVNLFADMTYEGGRGAVGAFLQHLGASGAMVGIIAGGGELAGFAIRSISGIIADRTGAYWIDAWIGYTINMLCVPALALVGSWPAAAGLVVGERVGRGIRKPVVAAVLAQAGAEIGGGRAFGLNEMLDQIGATTGPLIVALAIARSGSFSVGFGVLIVPAIVTLLALVPASIASRTLTPKNPNAEGPALRDRAAFWRYAAGGAFLAAGLVDFALIAFRFQRDHIASASMISVEFAAAMAVAAVSAPLFGRWFDRAGAGVMTLAIVLTSLATALAFLGNGAFAMTGAALWGVGTAVTDSLVLALVASVITQRRGATTFGLYDLVFGIAWFLGSAVAGLLLDRSLVGLVVFSVALQLLAIPLFLTRRVAR